MLPVPIGGSRNSNFEADVLETHSPRALFPMIFVISIFELTKATRSACKVLGVGSIGLLVSLHTFFIQTVHADSLCLMIDINH